MDQRSRDGQVGGWSKIFPAFFRESHLFLTSSCLTWGFHQPWTKLSRIPTSRKRSSWRNTRLNKQTDSFAEQTANLIYEHFWVTGVNDSVKNYADLFTVALRNDHIQEFDTRWNEFLLSMEQFPPDDIWDSLYELRIRESDKLKTILELYNLEIHQKKPEPDYHRLKTMVKRSIEQSLRMKNYVAKKRDSWVKHVGPQDKQLTPFLLTSKLKWKISEIFVNW